MIYSLEATHEQQTTPPLQRGLISIHAIVTTYVVIGENPQVVPGRSMLLQAGETREFRLPTKCCRVGVLAVKDAGAVIVTEKPGGAKASCAV